MDLKAITSLETILELQRQVMTIHVDEALRDYMLDIIRATREHSALHYGVSPRGSLALYKACQAGAALDGRSYVRPDDVKEWAPDVFRKRVVLTADAQLKGKQADRIIHDIIDSVPVPAFKERL